MGFWDTGLLSKWFVEGGTTKLKWIISFEKTTIPSFHYSMSEV
jgi:hypothetical protein